MKMIGSSEVAATAQRGGSQVHGSLDLKGFELQEIGVADGGSRKEGTDAPAAVLQASMTCRALIWITR